MCKMRSGFVGVLLFFILTLGGGIGGPLAASARQEGTPAPTLSCKDAGQVDSAAQIVMLTADCVTDVSLAVPDGWTFEGDGHAIFVMDPAGGRFRGGVFTIRGGNATVRDVVIDGSFLEQGCSQDAMVSGVLFINAAGSVERTRIIQIARGSGFRCGYGVIVSGPSPASITIEGNTIEGPGDGGVLVVGADATVRGNRIFDAGNYGVTFTGPETSGLIEGNGVHKAGDAGIRIEDTAIATIARNDVTYSGHIGIVVINGSSAQIAEGNRINRGDVGIAISGSGSQMVVERSTINSTSAAGIVVQSGASATITHAEIDLDATSGAGITVSHEGSRAEIADSIINAAQEPAILVQDGAYAKVEGNAVHGPEDDSSADFFGPYGIRFAGGAQGEIRENRVYGYASNPPDSIACAISVEAKDGLVQIVGNTFPKPSAIFPTPNDGAGICYGPPTP